MAVSIYFTETRDFRLIKDLISTGSEEFLVYVYTDIKNSKLPRELIKDLPVFGNNLIWVDSGDMDSGQLVNHVMLTIGQFLNAEDPINFVIASRTSKFDKAIQLLQDQNIAVEKAGGMAEPAKPAKRKKMGRPKGSGTKTATRTTRKKKAEAAEAAGVPEDAAIKPKRKPGRPPKNEAKKTKAAAEKKPAKKTTRKPREEKPITDEMIQASLAQFPTLDADVEVIQKKLFGMKKVQRPKFDNKLSEMIQADLGVGESEAYSLISKMKETGMMDNSGLGNRIKYKD